MSRLKKMGAVILFLLMVMTDSLRSNAVESELIKIRATCYVEHGITYSGHYTHEGILAGRKEDIGDVAAIYAVAEDGSVGEFIGYFEFEDCGAGFDTDGDGKGDSTIKGKTVDIFRDNLSRAKAWIKTYGDYVYIKRIEAEG